MEDPRREPRLLSWEYEDCCAVRREDVAGCNNRPRAQRRPYPGSRGADCGWDSSRGQEDISVDQQSRNGGYGGFWKGDVQYMDCRRADNVWEDKRQDIENRNYEVYERDSVQYRNCSSEIRGGRNREDRVPGQYRERGRQYGEDRGLGGCREGGRWYQDYRDPWDYSEDGRHYRKKELQHRQERDSGEYRERRRQYREDGGSQVYREGEKWYRDDESPRTYREQERPHIGIRDQVDGEDVERHRRPKGYVMDHSSPDRDCEVAAFSVRPSGEGSVSLGSGTCYTQFETRGVDSHGCGELEGEAPGPGMPAKSSSGAEQARVRTGRPDWSQVWEQEAEEANRAGSVLQRNSFYRRTAPSALRHSEFVQTRKKKQGTQRNGGQFPWACLHPALAPGQHWESGTRGWPAQTRSSMGITEMSIMVIAPPCSLCRGLLQRPRWEGSAGGTDSRLSFLLLLRVLGTP